MTLIIILWCLLGIVGGYVWKRTWSDLTVFDLLWCPIFCGLGPFLVIIILLDKYGDKVIIKKK